MLLRKHTLWRAAVSLCNQHYRSVIRVQGQCVQTNTHTQQNAFVTIHIQSVHYVCVSVSFMHAHGSKNGIGQHQLPVHI